MNEVLADILAEHLSLLEFVSKTSGIVTKMKVANSSNTGFKTVPSSRKFYKSLVPGIVDCEITENYTSVIPDAKERCVLFFEDLGARLIDSNRAFDVYFCRIKLVGWYNEDLIGKQDLDKVLNTVKYNIPETVDAKDVIIKGSLKVSEIYPKYPNPFSNYSLDEQNTQFLIQPFGFFALGLEAKLYVRSNCAINIEIPSNGVLNDSGSGTLVFTPNFETLSETLSVTLTTDSDPIIISNIEIIDDINNSFSVNANVGTVTTNNPLVIDITNVINMVGPYTGKLRITHNGQNSPYEINLSARGWIFDVVYAGDTDFGNMTVGDSETRTYTIVNNSEGAVVISSFGFAIPGLTYGPNFGGLRFLAVGQSLTFDVTYAPPTAVSNLNTEIFAFTGVGNYHPPLPLNIFMTANVAPAFVLPQPAALELSFFEDLNSFTYDNSTKDILTIQNNGIATTFSLLTGTKALQFLDDNGEFWIVSDKTQGNSGVSATLTTTSKSYTKSFVGYLNLSTSIANTYNEGASTSIVHNFRLQPSNEVRLGHRDSSQGSNFYNVPNFTIPTETKFHMAVTYDEVTKIKKFFFNGVLVHTKTNLQPVDVTGHNYFYVPGASGVTKFEGRMKKIKHWNVALTDAEVSDVYNLDF